MDNISFGFTLDDGISSALKSITEALAGTVNYLEDVNKSIENVDKKNFDTLKKNITQACSSIDQISQGFEEAGAKATGLNKTNLNSVSKTADKVSQSVSDIGNEALGSAANLKRIDGSSISSVSSAAEEATQAVDRLGDESQETGDQLSGISQKLGGLTKAIGGVVATYASIEGVKKALDWSDSISQTTSRLNLVNQSFNEINGSQQTTAELQNKIFQAAQASRGSYSSLQNLVASLGNNAKDAFSNTDEMVKFATNLNKTFAISGASSEEMANATLQLTQGLAAGALRGDELNSVLENAPELINVIANSMGVPRGQIRDLAAEGQITAEVVKNALINSSDEINAKFENMDVTFSQLWTQFTNTAQHAFQPVAQELSKLASSSEFQASMESLGNTIANLAPAIAEIVGKISSFAPAGLDLLVNSLKWVLDNAGAVSAGVISIAAAAKAIEFKNTHAEEISNLVDLLKTKLKGNTEAFNTWGQQASKATNGLATAFTKIVPDSLIAKTSQAKAGLLNLASTASTAVASKFNVLTSGISNFASSIIGSITNTKLFTSVLSPMGNVLGNAATGMLAFLKPLLSFGGIAGIAVAGVGLIAAALGAFNKGGNLSAGINSFFTNFTKSASDFGVMAVRAINTFSAKIPEVLPELIQRGIELVNSLIRGISTALPAIMQTAVSILSALVQGIANNLPLVIQGGIDFLSGLINAISTNLPMLMQSGMAIISQLLDSIMVNMPKMVDAGVQALKSLISGLVTNLPVIIQTGLQLILAFINGLVQNLPHIIEAGITLVTSLVDGLLQAVPAILSGAWQIITTLGQALWDNRVAIWNTLLELGSNIIEGIKQGLMVAWNGLTGWIGEKFNGLIDWVKSIFGIASPSTVFSAIGSDLLQGFWNGLKSIWDSLSNWLGGIWDNITSLFSGGAKQDNSVIDYTATIESTKAQLKELQEIVAQSFGNILRQIQITMSQITAQTTDQFSTLTVSVLNQINGLVIQTGSEILGITSAFKNIFTVLISITSSALAEMKVLTIKQVVDMIAQMGSSASGLNTVFLNAFNLMSRGTLQILAELNKGSIAILESLSKSASSVMNLTRVNMVAIVTNMSNSVINAYDYLRIEAVNLTNAMSNSAINTYSTLKTQAISLINAMSQGLIAIYQNLVNQIITVLTSLSNRVISLIQSLAKNFINIMESLPAAFKSVGIRMMTSLQTGIESSRAGVVNTMSSLVQQLKNVFEGGLGIHSPSDYMIWIGQMMLAGLIQGMSGDQVQKFIQSMIGSMQSSFENGKFNANELVNFLSDSATLNLIGRVTGMDTSGVSAEQIAYPLIGTLGTQTSWFGPRESPGGIGSTNHGGVDLAAPTGTPIAAALGGNVTVAGWYGGYGNAVVVDSGNGIDITYGHMSEVLAKTGQTVTKGQQIGLVGSTGNSTGPHLHFEMHQNGQRIDPQPYIEGASISAGNTLASAITNAYNLKHGIVTAPSIGNVSYDVSAGASQWATQVLQALAMLGQPASLLQGVLYAIDSESGGNPNAINNWDSNAAAGHPSQGLLQTIPSTFAMYRNPSLPNSITDPLANIYAGLNYMIHEYGGIENVVGARAGGWFGYEVGTRYVPFDMLAQIHKGEAIIPANQNPYSQSGGDYLRDMFNSVLPSPDNIYKAIEPNTITNTSYTQEMFDLEPTLSAEPILINSGSSGSTNNVTVTLNINQSINDTTDAKQVAKEAIDYLYDEIERQFNGTGGGVVLEY